MASGHAGGGVDWMARMTGTRVRLATARLYLCTDARSSPEDLASFLDQVLAGGVDLVQLRQKGMEAADELAALQIMATASKRHGALMCVNDRADIAYATRADLLHLGQGDLPVTVAREILGDDVIVGRSTHRFAESQAALAQPGVDYLAVGPCWPTPTKPGRPAPGLDLIRQVAGYVADRELTRPWFAIGGIDQERLPQVLEAGATRIVVVRALTEASDPRATAEALGRALDRSRERG